LLNEYFPNAAYEETPFPVTAVEPRKTFLEKSFLMHEEFLKPDRAKIKAERMSRHLYDLVNIMNTEIGQAALNDHELYDHLIVHRKWYTGFAWINYDTLGHSTIRFVPPAEFLEAYRQDYKTMQEQMIYEEALDFDDLIEQLKILQGRFRIKTEVNPLEEIIEDAKNKLNDIMIKDPDGTLYEKAISYRSDSSQPESENNKTIIYKVQFARNRNKLVFEDIRIIK
jgi:hypothetical protein